MSHPIDSVEAVLEANLPVRVSLEPSKRVSKSNEDDSVSQADQLQEVKRILYGRALPTIAVTPAASELAQKHDFEIKAFQVGSCGGRNVLHCIPCIVVVPACVAEMSCTER